MSEAKTRQVEAIEHGTVIDHLPPEHTLKAATVLAQADDQIFVGVNFISKKGVAKGVLKIAHRELDQTSLSQLALIAPEATINIIRDYKVIAKQKVSVPESFINIARCSNPNCVTNFEPCTTQFTVLDGKPLRVRCFHCERSFQSDQLHLL